MRKVEMEKLRKEYFAEKQFTMQTIQTIHRNKELNARQISETYDLPLGLVSSTLRHLDRKHMASNQNLQLKVVRMRCENQSFDKIQAAVKLDLLSVCDIIYVNHWESILSRCK